MDAKVTLPHYTEVQAPENIRKEHYDEINKENAIFEAYYNSQNIVPKEDWPVFLEALRKTLPATFRITGHREEAALTKRILEEKFCTTLGVASPRKLEWYQPEGHAWHMDIDRKSIRVDSSYAEFHKWLVAATENGDISRQEAVSMIPPLLLEIKAEHLILDICAAPGSKTAQLVEYLHADAQKRDIIPSGLVIANDSDQQRAYMLFHQVKRILSPSLLVTNNDGTSFPLLVQDDKGGKERVLFDRILADVPCSGDGTLRKNSLLWKSWTPNLGLGLHPLQVRLLEKAVRLLKVGGRLVYSTCSMNFVENEAVLGTVLSRYSHALKLVDVSQELPGFKRSPGMPTWKVINKDGCEYATCADVPTDQIKRFPSTVFPQPNYTDLRLDFAMRIYPHLQNTGGFFVAVIEKVAELSQTSDETDFGASNEKKRAPPAPKKGKKFIPGPKSEGEYRFMDAENDAVLTKIFDFYGIDKRQIIADGYGFLIRSDRDPVKTITIVSPQSFKIFKATARPRVVEEGSEIVLYNQSLKLVNAGVRAFEIYESSRPVNAECAYRLLSESTTLLEKYITKRIINVDAKLVKELLESQDSVRVEAISEATGGALLAAGSVKIPVWINERGVKAFVPVPNRPALLDQLLERL